MTVGVVQMTLECTWCRASGKNPIVGTRIEPSKVKKKTPNVGAGPQPCKDEANKIKQQAPTRPNAGVGPQTCKVEPNNNKQQLTNQRTNEQEAINKQYMYLQ
jgi:hypothetical protein